MANKREEERRERRLIEVESIRPMASPKMQRERREETTDNPGDRREIGTIGAGVGECHVFVI